MTNYAGVCMPLLLKMLILKSAKKLINYFLRIKKCIICQDYIICQDCIICQETFVGNVYSVNLSKIIWWQYL